MRLWKQWKGKWDRFKTLREWDIFHLKLIDARLYLVSIFVGALTGLITVPYHWLLQQEFNWRHLFFSENTHWWWHVPLFLVLWLMLCFVAWMVKHMPLIAGGGIPQTRGAINGRITYFHPFRELWAKFAGGVLSLGAGLSLGREGPSVQMGSYIATLVARWGRVLPGERKQLLAAGAGAGLAAAFAAPLASSLLVIESIERFDAPKTAITTLLAGVVAGGLAGWAFPFSSYSLINVVAPILPFWHLMGIWAIFAIIVSLIGKIYSILTTWVQRQVEQMRSGIFRRMFMLICVAYSVSLIEITITGGGEAFFTAQAISPDFRLWWVGGMLLLHITFTLFSFASGLPGGSFIPTLVTGGLLGEVFALLLVRQGIIVVENISYMMLIGSAAFLIAVVRTPLTAIVLITEIMGNMTVFYPSIIIGGLTYYFTEMLQVHPMDVKLYEQMVNKKIPEQQRQRYHLFVEIMNGSYFDGKVVNALLLPNRCRIISIRRGKKMLQPEGQTLIPGDQVEIEMDALDIEKLYEPLVSMANIY